MSIRLVIVSLVLLLLIQINLVQSNQFISVSRNVRHDHNHDKSDTKPITAESKKLI
jgi:hypothetical protein